MSDKAWKEYETMMDEEEPTPATKRSGFPLPILIALAAMVGFVWLSWYAYQVGTGGGHSEVRVMKAPEQAYKTKPAHPGGMKVPHQDKEVLHAKRNEEVEELPKVEALLPKEEEPIALHEQVKNTDKDTLIAAREAHFSGKPVQDSIKEVVDAKPTAPATTKPAPSYPEIVDIKEPAKPAPKVIDVSKPKVPPASKPAASAPTTKLNEEVKKMPGYRLQLGSFRSRNEVQEAWGKLAKAHPDLLSDLSYMTERTSLKDRGVFFRLHVGPFNDKAAPRNLCKSLQSRGQACFVVKRD